MKRGGTRGTIIIRTDGSHSLGLGHVYRSVSLARQLQKSGFDILFLTGSPDLGKIIPSGFAIKSIGNSAKKIQEIIESASPRIIILDKLSVGSREMKVLTSSTRVVGIDYTGRNKRMLGGGINMLYQTSGLDGRRSFSGFEFTVLNDAIRNAKSIKISRQIKRILVMQGGTDTRCNTPGIIGALDGIPGRMQVYVVAGPSFRCWKELEESLDNSRHRTSLLYNVKNMAGIMGKSDMAITGGGMTSLELCHLGVPSIIVCGEPFENETASMLERNGFGINLGYRRQVSRRAVAEAVKELISDYGRRKEMNRNGRRLVDSHGTRRTVEKIMGMIK